MQAAANSVFYVEMSYKFDAFVEDFMLDPPGHISDDGAKEDGKLVKGSDRKP